MSNREEPLIDAADPIERHRQAIRAIGHTARAGELLREWHDGPFRLELRDAVSRSSSRRPSLDSDRSPRSLTK